MEVVITKKRMLVSRQSLRPFTSLYEATGPDGTKFTNTSLVEIKRVMKRRYGRSPIYPIIDFILEESK